MLLFFFPRPYDSHSLIPVTVRYTQSESGLHVAVKKGVRERTQAGAKSH